jgi:hypothetical protein
MVRGRSPLFLGIALFLATGLAACGSASANSASATATPNCTPVRPAQTAQTATGTISNVTANSFQLTAASGKVTAVQITANTRITRIVAVSATSLAPGATVQVVPDAAGTTAQRITVVPQAGTGNGFGSRGGGRASGTPPAGFNPACLATRTPGRGPFQGNQLGVRGTVQSVSSTQIMVNDPQGQTLTFAITPSTQILTTAAGSASDLTQGSTATVTGTLSGTSLVARSIIIQPAALSAS